MRTDRRQHIRNSQLIDQIKATNDQNRLTFEKIRALLDALPSAVRTMAIMGRAAGQTLKAVRAHDEAMSRLKLYGATDRMVAKLYRNGKRIKTRGIKATTISFDEPITVDDVVICEGPLDQLRASKDLRKLFDSYNSNSPKSGRSGGVSVRDRGPKRSLIERSKAALMDFRAFASRKAGKAYRVERWRRG